MHEENIFKAACTKKIFSFTENAVKYYSNEMIFKCYRF